MIETLLAADFPCWTPERLQVKAWLKRNAPSLAKLAELYEGHFISFLNTGLLVTPA
jgi:hypothetical protein